MLAASPAQAHLNNSSGGVGSIGSTCIFGHHALTHDGATGMRVHLLTETRFAGGVYPCSLPKPGHSQGTIRVRGVLSTWDGSTWNHCSSMGGWRYNYSDNWLNETGYQVQSNRNYSTPPCGNNKWYRLRTTHQVWDGAQWVGGRRADRVHWYGVNQ